MFVLILLILGISIGYAFISSTLGINGTAGINKNTWDIHWNENSIVETPGSVTAKTPAYVSDGKKQKVEQIKEKKKALKEEKFNSLSDNKKALIKAKKVRKEEKNKLNEEKTLKEFNELRERTKEERLVNLELN